MEPSRDGYVELNGVRTWYAEYGDASADPLVLMHPGGGGTDSRAFGPTLEGLAARFRVFTPERRGHGRTPDHPGPISYDLMAQDTIHRPGAHRGPDPPGQALTRPNRK
jgi:pimeloyl-ACP methyl ester carboxylesterase